MLGPWMTRNPVSSSDDVKHSLFHNNKILSMSVFNSSDVQRVIGAYPICCWLHMKEMITTQQRSHPTLSINTDPAWESPGSAVLNLTCCGLISHNWNSQVITIEGINNNYINKKFWQLSSIKYSEYMNSS
jgi:hypothetical protein